MKVSRIVKERSEDVDGALDKKPSAGSNCAGETTARASAFSREGGTCCGSCSENFLPLLVFAQTQLLNSSSAFHNQDIASLQAGVKMRQKLKSWAVHLRSFSKCYIVLHQSCGLVPEVFMYGLCISG